MFFRKLECICWLLWRSAGIKMSDCFFSYNKQQILKVNYFLYMGVPHLSRVALYEKKSNIQWSMCGFKGFSRSDPPPPPHPFENSNWLARCFLLIIWHIIIAYFFLQKIQWLYFLIVFLWKILEKKPKDWLTKTFYSIYM